VSDGWAWAEAARERALRPLPGGFRIETVADDPGYWAAWEAAFGREGFPPEMYFARGAEREERAKRLEDARGARPLVDRWLIHEGDDERVVAVYRGEQLDGHTYSTWHASVHPGFRRRGIYRALIERVLESTRELGFTSVVSNHAPGNNPAIIAKLSLGFRIDRLDLDALHGPTLWLRYFHDPDELAAYEFRCGLATLTPELLKRRYGAWAELDRQLAGADER
jgi:GNAT superfamily N-acetyltransferase